MRDECLKKFLQLNRSKRLKQKSAALVNYLHWHIKKEVSKNAAKHPHRSLFYITSINRLKKQIR